MANTGRIRFGEVHAKFDRCSNVEFRMYLIQFGLGIVSNDLILNHLKKLLKNVLPTILIKNASEDLWNVAKSNISITLHEVFKTTPKYETTHAKYDV